MSIGAEGEFEPLAQGFGGVVFLGGCYFEVEGGAKVIGELFLGMCWMRERVVGDGAEEGGARRFDFPFFAGDFDCMAAEVDFIAMLDSGGAEVGGLCGFAGLVMGLLVDRSEYGVVGNGSGEILEIEFGDAPGEEFFGPEGDCRGW